MRCPKCASLDDRVVDSRNAQDGAAIRRRRECGSCGHRFTTFERAEELPLVVDKQNGTREPFERSKIVGGVQAAAKGRPLELEQLEQLAAEVEESFRVAAEEVVASDQIGQAVLERLKVLDRVAYVRFASVYKDFEDVADFEREVDLLTGDDASAPEPSS